MKKFLVVLMAVGLAFAMISCGGGNSATDNNAYITKDLNWPADAGSAPANPAQVSTEKGGTLEEADLEAPTLTQSPVGYNFIGWFDAPEDGEEVDTDYVFDDSATIYAYWDEVGTVTITKDLNWPDEATGTQPEDIEFEITLGATLTPAQWAAPSGANAPSGYSFIRWEYEDGAPVLETDTFEVDTTIIATWIEAGKVIVTFVYGDYDGAPNDELVIIDDLGSVGSDFPSTPSRTDYLFIGWYVGVDLFEDDTIVEGDTTVTAVWSYVDKIKSANGAFAAYKFIIPEGGKLGDYSKLLATYKLESGALTDTIRSRLMGPFSKAKFDEYFIFDPISDTNDPEYGMRLMACIDSAAYTPPTNLNGPYILNNKAQDVAYTTLGIAALNTWTEIEYPFAGGEHGDFVAENLDLDITGEVWFCVGITRQGEANFAEYLATNIYLSDADGDTILRTVDKGNIIPAADSTEKDKAVFIGYKNSVQFYNYGVHPTFVDDPARLSPTLVKPNNGKVQLTKTAKFNWIGGNEHNQIGWQGGTNAETPPVTFSDYTPAEFVWADYLVLKLTKELTASGASLIYRSDTAGWETIGNFVNNGAVVSSVASYSGSVAGNNLKLTISIPKLLEGIGTNKVYNGFVRTSSLAGLLIQYWNENLDEIITDAYLVIGPITPEATDFTVTGLTQTEGEVVAPTITAKTGIGFTTATATNIQYEGTGDTTYTKSSTAPQVEGTYKVTFDVAAVGTLFTAASDLVAGTLTVEEDTGGGEDPEDLVIDVTEITLGSHTDDGDNLTITDNVVVIGDTTDGGYYGFSYDFSDLDLDLYDKVEITLKIEIGSNNATPLKLTTKSNTSMSNDLKDAEDTANSQYINNSGAGYSEGDDTEVTIIYSLEDCVNDLILWQIDETGNDVVDATITITGIKFILAEEEEEIDI
jgi:hypothetical protein